MPWRERRDHMNINGINYGTSVPASTIASKTNGTTSTKTTRINNTSSISNVIYDVSNSAEDTSSHQTKNETLITQLKADAAQRTFQLQNLVKKMMQQQGIAIGKADDIWSVLANGEFTVDAETKAQAQKDIAEDGYWGVAQTSDRIIEFAKALTGGDASKAEAMRTAFEKGFKEAAKTWGKELPSISQDTYNAVMAKFDNWIQESN